jgi:hypothetical protein
MDTKGYVKLVGIVIGGIGFVVLVINHPMYASLIAEGAAVYFMGEYFIK